MTLFDSNYILKDNKDLAQYDLYAKPSRLIPCYSYPTSLINQNEISIESTSGLGSSRVFHAKPRVLGAYLSLTLWNSKVLYTYLYLKAKYLILVQVLLSINKYSGLNLWIHFLNKSPLNTIIISYRKFEMVHIVCAHSMWSLDIKKWSECDILLWTGFPQVTINEISWLFPDQAPIFTHILHENMICWPLQELTWVTQMQNKANLRDLIAATGLVILFKRDSIVDFSVCETLKFDGWPPKIIGHLFYTTSSFVHHFKAISELKMELQSGNAQCTTLLQKCTHMRTLM